MIKVISDKDLDKLQPIIEYLETHNEITPQTAKILVDKSDATVRRYMGILVDAGGVVQKGNTNNVTYVKCK